MTSKILSPLAIAATLLAANLISHSDALAGNLKQKSICNGSDPTCAPGHKGHSNTGVTIPDCHGAHRGPNGTMIQCK